MSTLSEKQAGEFQTLLERVLYELKKVVVGQEHLLERLLLAVATGGHVLVEGPPGLAKTLALKSLARVLSVSFKRIQFTPDLLPSDLIGTQIYDPGRGAFYTEPGPVFAGFVLADEINRAPAKVQSALLEAMQEQQVTIGRETFPLPRPFLVMATQNPIESEGTFNLPEAQLDRFLFKLLIPYPSPEEEVVILQRMTGEALPEPEPILDAETILSLMEAVRAVYLDPKLMHYIVALVNATRHPEHSKPSSALVSATRHPEYSKPSAALGSATRHPEPSAALLYGASPRGSLALANAGKALALINGRTYVTPADIEKLVHDCLRHRLVLSYEGLSDGLTPDKLLSAIMERIPAPVMTGA